MKHQFMLVIGSVLLVTHLGCQREPALRVEVPDRLTLYSIDGDRDEPDLKSVQDPETMFHGYPILGKVTIDDPKHREALIAAFNRGIAASDGVMAKCFWPRHAVRLEKNGKTTDYLICFQCLQFVRYQGDQQAGFAIDKSPQPLFNEELKRAGIPLAPTRGKVGD